MQVLRIPLKSALACYVLVLGADVVDRETVMTP
jgi:hypothetical protein